MALTQIETGMLKDLAVTAAKMASGAARANFGAGAVLQVVQSVLTSVSSGSNNLDTGLNNFADSGLAVTITPSSASSKILVMGSLVASSSQTYERLAKRLLRGSTPIYVGTQVGNRGATIDGTTRSSSYGMESTPFQFLDSPATTSATTYKMQIATSGGGTVTWYVNQTAADGDNNTFSMRGVSVITAMEIAG